MQNGKFSILNTTEYRKTGNAVLLSDILEDVVDQKYFLSKEQTERIVFVGSDTETDTEETPKSSIGVASQKHLTQQPEADEGTTL